VWLEDYQLACHAGGATDDLFVIKNLPLYLGDSARTWLKHLLRDKIHDWIDPHWVFVGNFQGTYTLPGKQWELRNCKQQPGSLREYIRRFSKCCTELPGATDNDAISAFQNDTTCTSLIHRLGRCMPRTTRELLRATTPMARKQLPRRSTPLRAGGNKLWTTVRGRPRASRRRRRMTSAAVMTT
jgi:hypothetical protein